MRTLNWEDIEKTKIIEVLEHYETFNRIEAILLNEREEEEIFLINNVTAQIYKENFMN